MQYLLADTFGFIVLCLGVEDRGFVLCHTEADRKPM